MKTQTSKVPKPITLQRISYLIYEKGIEPSIAHLDLEMVKMKLMETEEGPGWKSDYCDYTEIEYKRFLHLNKKYSEAIIVPHQSMDIMWHQHILDTRAYHSDCNKVFGEYFHHFPYFGIRGKEDKEDLDFAFEETQLIYAKEFNDEMIKLEPNSCKSGCNSSGKCKSRKKMEIVSACRSGCNSSGKCKS